MPLSSYNYISKPPVKKPDETNEHEIRHIDILEVSLQLLLQLHESSWQCDVMQIEVCKCDTLNRELYNISLFNLLCTLSFTIGRR